ncbi:MCP four helix bundle domain-containing protein [Siphonobacter aquaeclarae]|uniref:Four helix bundle sensory module for signal transduction n=1 Tax=Siphonobacter aquaeclarae TaxID=563176 RepID=A0A1G9NNU3_9BACT|nr:MCP four helix bundle domain-containing protein [Siphonobacter aquaeclarae]SDL88258.1 Four helix bundle sensory module for signal transduction [Siphonobacter aquaeclarae]
MKWTFIIQQKMKAALALGSIMLLIVLSNFVSRGNLRGVGDAFVSMYQDRLIPAVDLIYLTDHLYSKRLLVEKTILSGDSPASAALQSTVAAHNQSLDSLLAAFAKTKLVDQESKTLSALKLQLAEYNRLETRILALSSGGSQEEARALFDGVAAGSFRETLQSLSALTEIQSKVGKELIKSSNGEVAQMKSLAMAQMALAVIVALVIFALIYSSSAFIQPKSNSFHLN